MSINRRNFLELAALSSVTILAGTANGEAVKDINEYNKNAFGVLVDTTVCIGCRKCEWACNKQHSLTHKDKHAFEDKSVFKEHRRPTKNAYTVVNQFFSPDDPNKKYTMKIQCMHCVEPACVSACIVGAMEKTEHGPVIYDSWKCIGCRYCMVACPFQIPAYQFDDPIDPKVRKCTFCFERNLEAGNVPACVEICPTEALTFCTRQELIELAHQRLEANPDRYVDHVYGEKEIGGTSWMYLAPIGFKYTELPNLPSDEPIPEHTEEIQHGIFRSFAIPLGLYGLLGFIMRTLKNNPKEETKNES